MHGPKCTHAVRGLLVELDHVFERYHENVKVMADPQTADSIAVHAGHEHRSDEHIIIGLAWRINKASKGITE
jgi:hypothetical protein